ncbi:hypothetical protein P154DRAFT_501204 [Amniculicola lignicola CBS 123094]|uniref:Phosphoribosyltransferase domain-containing protein n=1 Tax=Amniculicola lignicola CBS 123094 TaxID=1392246 RepID=A0A6A5WB87_9PLEO|nr:hypothetical protein P154DRAFT_501204 [Amniculicola lignicola CBS 123094]
MSSNKPTIVGVYGLPGSGKTTLLIKLMLDEDLAHFQFFESSKVLNLVTSSIGGLKAFEKLPEDQKGQHRIAATRYIRDQCTQSGKSGVVAGHYMFWNGMDEEGQCVWTEEDLHTYTHIIYLDCHADTIYARSMNDNAKGKRKRESTSVAHLAKWQEKERSELRRLCREGGILFCADDAQSIEQQLEGNFSDSSTDSKFTIRIKNLLQDFCTHNASYNLSCAQARLDTVVQEMHPKPTTMVVLDADRTLTARDTGEMFWDAVALASRPEGNKAPLKTLFGSPLGYSYEAFRQAALLYDDIGDNAFYEKTCQSVAVKVKLYAELLGLIQRLKDETHVRMVIITCGLRRTWEMVLEKFNLHEKVSVVGGGRISDGFVVTAAVKAALVDQLRTKHHMHVWAFGDSSLDLDMFKKADQAVVVVGEREARSKTMDAELRDAIDFLGLRARQVLVPDGKNHHPRLSEYPSKLPVIKIDEHLYDAILGRKLFDGRKVIHATNQNQAMVLMTSMRDANISGPALRDVHRRVGWYLAHEFVSNIIGIEEYEIAHVQGNPAPGYRLRNEKNTLIVALMRGGEPMAFGVSDAFPLAWFVHAKPAADLKPEHLKGKQTVILVDSVVNEGTSVMEFVDHIRAASEQRNEPPIRIIVVTGVAQAKSVTNETRLGNEIQSDDMLSLVALRLSDNRFKGKGATDTGHRLFNTTALD